MDQHPSIERQLIRDRHEALRRQAEVSRLRRDAKALRKHLRQSG